MFRYPSKILWWVSVCWAALVAIGVASAIRRPRASARAAFLGAFSCVAVAALFAFVETSDSNPSVAGMAAVWSLGALGLVSIAWVAARNRSLLVAAVVILDLVLAGRNDHAYSRSGDLFRTRPGIVDVLNSQAAFRTYLRPDVRRERGSWKAPAGWTDEEAFYFGQAQLLVSPQGARWGVRGSFDGDFTGLARRDYTLFCSLLEMTKVVNPLYLRMAGVTHAIGFSDAAPPGADPAGVVPTFHDRAIALFHVRDPLPPAYLVSGRRIVRTSEEGFTIIEGPDFDPTREVALYAGKSLSERPRDNSAIASAQIERQVDSSVLIRARTMSPQSLVWLTGYSKGWRARVDGNVVPTNVANLLFLSVELEAGEHTIEFDYETPGLLIGVVVSCIAWIAVGVRLTAPSRQGLSSPVT